MLPDLLYSNPSFLILPKWAFQTPIPRLFPARLVAHSPQISLHLSREWTGVLMPPPLLFWKCDNESSPA